MRSPTIQTTAECLLLELPTASLRTIVGHLSHSARDVAALACCCQATASLCEDPLVWRELVIKRYGKSVLPGMQPSSEQSKPDAVEQFVFYQGMDGSGESDNHHGDKTLQELANITAAAHAQAFTTTGMVIQALKPQTAWKHTSFRPYEGMYVRAAEVQHQRLSAPDVSTDDWPPVMPGWVYFPSCVSSGFFRKEAHHGLENHKTLQHLLAACSQQADIVAVTTTGETKMKLRPQACWGVHPEYDVGMYVKAEVVQRMGLVPCPPVPDYRKWYAQLAQSALRLDASRMTCAWLNDQYLSLEPMVDSPAESGMALVLHHVWWLDIQGSILGVPPGNYEVAWVVDVRQAQLHGEVSFKLLTERCPVNDDKQDVKATEANAPDAVPPPAAAPAAAAALQTADDVDRQSTVQMEWLGQAIESLASKCARQHTIWGILTGGVIEVKEYSTLKLQFKDTSNTLKSRIRWAFVQLIPLQPGQVYVPKNRAYVPGVGPSVVAPRGSPNGIGVRGFGGSMFGLLDRLFGGRLFHDDDTDGGAGGGHGAPFGVTPQF